MKRKTWALLCLAALASTLVLLSAVVIAIDPFQIYRRAERFLPDLFQLFFHKRMLLFVIIQKNKALRPDRGRKTRLPRYHPLFAEILRCFWPGNGGHAGAS